MSTVIFWFDQQPGIKIFFNAGVEYHKRYNVYPRVVDQIPKFLTELGYPCDYIFQSGTHQVDDGWVSSRKGLLVLEKDSAWFLLRWG